MRMPFFLRSLAACLAGLASLCGAALGQPAGQPRAVVVALDASGKLVVGPWTAGVSAADRLPRALLVWSTDGQREHWRWSGQATLTPGTAAAVARAAAGPTRGESAPAATQDLFATTIQLRPLERGVLLRGSLFLTPVDKGVVLDPRPTIRRMPLRNTDTPYPARTAVLSDQQNRPLLRMAWAAGQAEMAWRDVPGLPAELAAGLPPGRYTLQLEGGLERCRFTVAGPAERMVAEAPIAEMARLVGDPQSPLLLQFSIEQLLAERDARGTPRYLADVLDRIAAAPSGARTPYIDSLGGQIRRWLENLASDTGYVGQELAGINPGDNTGMAAIDEARQLMAAGRWSAAAGKLERDAGAPPEERRAAGLRALYTAVVDAEAGSDKQPQAEAAFGRALELLADAPPADRIRARVNYANYLVRLAQDRLNNHAFQIAAGVPLPILTALEAWAAAAENYTQTLDLVGPGGSGQERATIEAGLAGLCSLLADLAVTLAPPGGLPACVDIQRTAVAQADLWARRAAADGGGQPALSAASATILAELALRAGDHAQCRRQAAVALAELARGGGLAGVENVEHLLGVDALEAGQPDEALRHFQTALLLVELLRRRFPGDRAGLSRAGFFSRRCYVYEQIADLLVDAGRPAEALAYAERGKARAVQDLLAADGPAAAGRAMAADREAGHAGQLDALLGSWPRDTAAVEYLLSQRRALVFVVNAAGRVGAWPLGDSDGRPIAPRRLIAQCRTLLGRMDRVAQQMRAALEMGQSLDYSWQDDLHSLYEQLLPAAARAHLASGWAADGAARRRLVIVPHYILHYFPFAALVVQCGTRPHDPLAMVSPRFFIDEGYDLINAPSLAVWDMLRGRPVRRPERVAAVGLVNTPGAPDLPGVAQDLANFRRIFGPGASVLQGSEVALDKVGPLLAQSDLLLLATHGLNEPDHPLDSFLLFQPPEGPDPPGGPPADPAARLGRLSARQIFASRVRADTVVLSACYSGLGDRSPLPGDDLFGLQRAFLRAGARNVVSGLWDVYDGSAPDLTRGFFEHLAAGEPAGHALAQSQREFLARLRQGPQGDLYLHPYFWAVFNVAGCDSGR